MAREVLEERTSGNESFLHMLASLPSSFWLEVEACKLAKTLLLDLDWAPKESRLALLTERGGSEGLTPFMKALKEKRIAIAIAFLRIAMAISITSP